MMRHETQAHAKAAEIIDRWCQDNGITDLRPYRHDTAVWGILWPPYTADCQERVIRGINIEFGPEQFVVYVNVFRNHRYPPLVVNPNLVVMETDLDGLVRCLDAAREAADRLTEDDLVPTK